MPDITGYVVYQEEGAIVKEALSNVVTRYWIQYPGVSVDYVLRTFLKYKEIMYVM